MQGDSTESSVYVYVVSAGMIRHKAQARKISAENDATQSAGAQNRLQVTWPTTAHTSNTL